MSIFLKNLYHPERFHGFKKQDNFFEGWYYKFVAENRANSIAIIPGIFISKDKSKHFSFIQILDSQSDTSYFIRFDASQFIAERDKFKLTIGGDNHFSEEGIKLNINQNDIKIIGESSIQNSVKFPVTVREPGIMGWYAYIPFMECNHALISMDCDIEGEFIVNGETANFSGGKGYIEKDWGSSFPEAYVWLQGNHFESETPISIAGSVAIIPWIRNAFRGFIFVLLINNKLLKFATYNNSKLDKFEVNGEISIIELRNADYLLQINAEKKTGVILAAPYNGSMEGRIAESLDSIVKIVLLESKTKKIIFEGTSSPAAVEIAGNIPKLLSYK